MQGAVTKFEARIDELERRNTASNAEISRLYNRLHQASSTEDDMKKELEAMDNKTMQLQRHIRRQSERRRELEQELHWKAKELNSAVSSVECLHVHRQLSRWVSSLVTSCMYGQDHNAELRQALEAHTVRYNEAERIARLRSEHTDRLLHE